MNSYTYRGRQGFASPRQNLVAKAKAGLAQPMEAKYLVMVVLVAVWMLLMIPEVAEGAFGIQLNPCTQPQCNAECKKALQEKCLIATCASGPQGKFCICLG
ncbi:hypothetical protein NMG60_11004652 [Bertholletia excelsa]